MKIILRILLLFFFIIASALIYLSTAGIETSRFNNQIISIIKNFNQDLEIELKKVKIVLDPFNLEINAKTVGPKFKIKDKSLELESVKTKIMIDTIINNNFSLKNLDISTKSLEIGSLISFIRNFKNTPELYILEKIFKKGYLISDINLEFDDEGKIKDNYIVKGLVKDAQIKFLKKYNIKDISFNFNFEEKKLELVDLSFFLNDTQLISKKLSIENVDDIFLVKGLIENKKLDLENKLLSSFLKKTFPMLDFIDLDLNSKNQFSFRLNKKFKINDLKLSSELQIVNLTLKNNLELKKFFPNIQQEINFNNHSIKVDYEKKFLSINGQGQLSFQDKKDFIDYNFLKKKKIIDFRTNFKIDENPINIDFLNYIKDPNLKAEIILKGSHTIDKKTIIDSFIYSEKKNKMKIDHIVLNKNLKLEKVKKIHLEYSDNDSRENDIKILKKNEKNLYNIIGSKFNANNLIENLLSDESNDLKIFDKNFYFDIMIDQVFLDKEYTVNDLNGNFSFKKNEIVNAELYGNFSKKEKLKFTIKSNESEKVTTLFLDLAEPIVKRYEFIKGYRGGSLDFYSSKKLDKSFSNLKIYNFHLKELPILTKLLTLASLQGIADILSGEGITFDEFEMNFENQNTLMTINEMYAIGPAISILMDGYIEKNKLISLRGSLVPATTINKAIGNIPVLGKILVGSKTGEGVFGVSFKIKGPPGKLQTTVNPIKTLTPRFITRTLEKIKKN